MSQLFSCRHLHKILSLPPGTWSIATLSNRKLSISYNQGGLVASQRPYSTQYAHTYRISSLSAAYSSNVGIRSLQGAATIPCRFYCDNFHKYCKSMNVPSDVFCGSTDRFNGVTVDSSSEYVDTLEFTAKLKKSLTYWQESGRRAIWFKVRTEHADWIPHLTKNEFEFHYAKQGEVVLYRWLPSDQLPNLPVYAHTMIGVGGLVVNDRNEVLVVSERHALIPNSWKLPGGYVEPRENLINAVIREVREETGIDSTFRTVISIRHSHGGGFGCSDIYVVIALKPSNLILKKCEREIADLQWLPIAEYLQHPHIHETNRHFLRTYLDYEQRGIRFTCEIGKHQILKKEYCLYFMKSKDDNDTSVGKTACG